MQLTYVILLQELLRVVVAVDVDLGKCIVDSGVLRAGLNAGFQPGQDELQTIASLDLVNKLVNSKVPRDGRKQRLDGSLVTVNIQKTSNDLRSANRVDALHVDLNEVEQPVLVQIQDKVMNEVEPVADNDER